MINSDITLNEAVQNLRKLKCNKAIGIDFISNEVLKRSGIHFVLHKLFSFIFDSGIVEGHISLWDEIMRFWQI